MTANDIFIGHQMPYKWQSIKSHNIHFQAVFVEHSDPELALNMINYSTEK